MLSRKQQPSHNTVVLSPNTPSTTTTIAVRIVLLLLAVQLNCCFLLCSGAELASFYGGTK
jgi:hypothetical protein